VLDIPPFHCCTFEGAALRTALRCFQRSFFVSWHQQQRKNSPISSVQTAEKEAAHLPFYVKKLF
jgi:hypothetical protein